MPLTKFHTFVGAAAGTSFFVLDKRIKKEEASPDVLAACFLLGGLAGSLPDILEPPLHRGHRSFFHSFLTLGAVLFLMSKVDSSEYFDSEQKSIIKSFLAAYSSHLVVDSTTPMGLPMVV